jgi:hypothetical protein
MGSFFGGILSGQNPTLSNDINSAGGILNFGTGTGETDITDASNFYKTILNGNPEETAKLLAPQISTIQGQGQQQLDTTAQFGNRSGGTNASNQTNMDTERANVERMIAQLTGGAAGALTGIGENALGTGLQANQVQAGESENKLKNEIDSIFGNVIGETAGAATSAGLGELGL